MAQRVVKAPAGPREHSATYVAAVDDLVGATVRTSDDADGSMNVIIVAESL